MATYRLVGSNSRMVKNLHKVVKVSRGAQAAANRGVGGSVEFFLLDTKHIVVMQLQLVLVLISTQDAFFQASDPVRTCISFKAFALAWLCAYRFGVPFVTG